MPAKSKSQQQSAGIALAAKRGEMPVSELKGASLEMYKSMTAEQLEEYAGTKHKGLPEKKKSGRGGNMRQKSYAKYRREHSHHG